jgi:hypothetical protein
MSNLHETEKKGYHVPADSLTLARTILGSAVLLPLATGPTKLKLCKGVPPYCQGKGCLWGGVPPPPLQVRG